MNDFDLSSQEGNVMAGSTDIPMLIVGLIHGGTCKNTEKS